MDFSESGGAIAPAFAFDTYELLISTTVCFYTSRLHQEFIITERKESIQFLWSGQTHCVK